jgi:general secretion pathway protein K
MKTLKMLKDESGAALLMAAFAVMMLIGIAFEIIEESMVDYVVSAQAVNRVKSYYAAKAGVDRALLHIQLYRKAQAMFGSQLQDPSILDQIWRFDVTWPLVIPKSASAVDRDAIKSNAGDSLMKDSYAARIESESAKIDINDLGSPNKVIADSVTKQLMQIINNKVEHDELFAKKYRGFEFQRLFNNIADWIDEDKESRNGGDESALYADREPQSDFLPPNGPFKTLQELHQVADMNDDIYELLAPYLTVYGSKGININYAKKEVLMSLSPQITEDRANKIIEARNDPKRGPFKNEEDFMQFLATLGIRDNPFRDSKDGKDAKTPLLFDAEYNFRITSTGFAGKASQTIVAITFDSDRVKDRLKAVMASASPTPPPAQPTPQHDAQGNPIPPQPTPTPAPDKKEPPKIPTDKPQIVYWNES